MSRTASARTVFTSKGYVYEIYDTLLKHPHYDVLLLAWRRPVDSDSRASVVMKRIPMFKGNASRERALEELQIAMHLKHPNIVEVLGLASHDDREFYVVMESVPGLYLATMLDVSLLLGREVSPAFAAHVAAMVADALVYVHGRTDSEGHPLHIVHRAVGPMCVRLGFDGSVKLSNFGSVLSATRDRIPTTPGLLRGDAAFTAPELWRAVMAFPGPRLDRVGSGLIDGKADVFSLGLMLLDMLLGEYPLDPVDAVESPKCADLVQSLRTERPTWIAPGLLADRVLRFNTAEVEKRSEAIPKGLRDIVRRALHRDPEERSDALEMREGLRAYLGSLEHPFGAEALASEIKAGFDAARRAGRPVATPVERTALTWGEDEGTS